MILRAMLFDAQAARCFADALRVVGRHPEYAAGASFEAVAVLDRMVALGRRPGAYIHALRVHLVLLLAVVFATA